MVSVLLGHGHDIIKTAAIMACGIMESIALGYQTGEQ